MAGSFLLGEKKVRPGVYYRRERAGITTEGAINGICAVLYQSNWGALNEVFDFDQTMLNELSDYAGDGADIIREALLGGATTVRAVRVGGADGTSANITLKTATTVTRTVFLEDLVGTLPEEFTSSDTLTVTSGDNTLAAADYTVADGQITVKSGSANKVVNGKLKISKTQTATDAVKITAKYPGARAFTIVVDDDLITDDRRVRILDGVQVFQQFTFAPCADESKALVNAMSNNRYFVAEKIAAGVLANVTQKSFTAGTNPTVVNDDYAAGTNVLERYRWNVIIADSSSKDIHAMLFNFVKQSYETGHLGMACVAEDKSVALETRMQHAAAYNDEKVVYVLNGWKSITDVEYDGWLAAARIGGMIAGSETNTSVTHDVIQSAVSLLEPLTNGEMIRAETKGCLVLSINDDDQIWVDNAINTLVTLGANMDEGWKKIRRTKCRFELMDRINRTHDKLIGNINNDDNGRATIIAAAQKVINEMAGEAKLMPQSYVELDEAHPPEGDRVYLKLYILDIDSAEFIYSTYVYRFNQTFDEEE